MSKNKDKSSSNEKSSAAGCLGAVVIGFGIVVLLSLLHPTPNYSFSDVVFTGDYAPDEHAFSISYGKFISDRSFTFDANKVINKGNQDSSPVQVKLLASPATNGTVADSRDDDPVLASIDLGVIKTEKSAPETPMTVSMNIPWQGQVRSKLRLALYEGTSPSRQLGKSVEIIPPPDGFFVFDPENWMKATERPHCWIVVGGGLFIVLAANLAWTFARRRGWTGWGNFLARLPLWSILVFVAPQAARFCLLAGVSAAGESPARRLIWLFVFSVGGGVFFAGGALVRCGRRQGWLPAQYSGYALLCAIGISTALTIRTTRSASAGIAQTSPMRPGIMPADVTPPPLVPPPATVPPDAMAADSLVPVLPSRAEAATGPASEMPSAGPVSSAPEPTLQANRIVAPTQEDSVNTAVSTPQATPGVVKSHGPNKTRSAETPSGVRTRGKRIRQTGKAHPKNA